MPEQKLKRAAAGLKVQCRQSQISAPPALVAIHLAARFGLTPSIAGVVAELAYPAVDSWRGRA